MIKKNGWIYILGIIWKIKVYNFGTSITRMHITRLMDFVKAQTITVTAVSKYCYQQ